MPLRFIFADSWQSCSDIWDQAFRLAVLSSKGIFEELPPFGARGNIAQLLAGILRLLHAAKWNSFIHK